MALNFELSSILSAFECDENGIYLGLNNENKDQILESDLRKSVANKKVDDYLFAISKHHSVPVMDKEVRRFLDQLPLNATILDVGGSWGWHWRNVSLIRPDVNVIIVDYVKENLMHAIHLLGENVNCQVALMHADALHLPFKDQIFSGIWSVQVFQHIVRFRDACYEAFRVLRPNGKFAVHNLHRTPFNRMVYYIFGRKFHTDGQAPSGFHLTRAHDEQVLEIADIFGLDEREVISRYTECLFHPDLRITFPGKEGSLSGKIDSFISNTPFIAKLIARQRGFEVTKPF